MPRETVIFDVNDTPVVEAFAELIAYIVWPKKADVTRRSEFQRSYCFWAISRRSRFDSAWAALPTGVRPATIVGKKNDTKQFKKNIEQLRRITMCARLVLNPFLPEKPRTTIAGLPPRIENIMLDLAAILDQAPGSSKTLEARVWKDAKPTVHLASSLQIFLSAYIQEHAGEPTFEADFASLLFNEEALRFVLDQAERLRLRLPTFEMKNPLSDSETIQFVVQ